MNLRVIPCRYKDIEHLILYKHYLMRRPPCSWSFALVDEKDNIVGACTIGKPGSNHLCIGLMGKEYQDKVFELNRLYVDSKMPKNTTSWFLARILNYLKQEDIVLVSFADQGYDDSLTHYGYIYQATNWIYTGESAKRTDTYNPKGTHPRVYEPKEEYKHLRRLRSVKHRYVFFCTTKGKAKLYKKALKYPILSYPKGENRNYVVGAYKMKTAVLNTNTNEVYYE